MKISTRITTTLAEQEDDEAIVEQQKGASINAKKPSTPSNTKPRLKKPPSGTNKPPTRKQMVQMAEAAMLGGSGPGDTFLTDMLMPGGAAKKGAKKGKAVFQSAKKPNFRAGSAGPRMGKD